MNDDSSFHRFAGIAAIISFPVAWGGTLLGLMSAGFDPVALSDPARMVAIGPDRLGLMNWSMLLYLLGYYVFLIPVALFLYGWLYPKAPNWSRFSTLSGMLYIVLGIVASALALGVHPPLIRAYAESSALQREMLATAFGALWYAQVFGLTGIAQNIPAIAWWLSLGLLLRTERRSLGTFTLILGVGALVGAFATLFQASQTLGSVTFFLTYVIIAPVWAFWLGIELLRMYSRIDSP